MQQKDTYTGRFGKKETKQSEAEARRPRQETERKPSGFTSAGQAPRKKPAPQPEPPKKKKEKKVRIKKDKAPRKRGEKKPVLKKVLIALGAVLLIALILILAFGDKGTYHMMPTITREEAQPSFEPDKTPMPGVQEAI